MTRRTARGAAASAALALLALPLLPSGQASAASYSVAMKGYAFSPAALSVPVGSTVTWTNQDTAPHDVKTTSGPVSIHSPMLNKGQSWSFTFGTPGSYGYYCTVHPDMTARITVRAAAPATTAAPTHDHSESSGSSGSSGTSGSSGSSAGHAEHEASSPSRTTAGGKTPTMSMPASSPASTAPGAAVPQAPTSPQPGQLAQPQAAASSVRPLDPLLVLAGIVAGVAVLCLLVVGSRAAVPRGEEEAGA
ncbi:cupredoxin family copper-binding protein [Streptomyces sp. AC555_RSS877]|uniref:cupredoxin domain-containing protein n=1 Tax=Streptomyces sp. AC555_RSS877 TaxID=2823688 RepID=UPI001C26E683|nr:cupredoxin family copper-binding protein [Streptomyces sp. AC555_RSS877]